MKALRRSGLPPDALCSIVDPLETQNFRVIAQLAEGGCAGVALETERPERLLESEGVGYAVCRHPQRVGVCLQMLQFLVLKWCDHALGMDLSQGAVMQAVVSLGIAVGAFLAAAKVPLKKSLNVLPMGICMGVLVVGASYFTRDIAPAGGLSLFGFELSWAVMIAGLIMILVGICAGFFVVPMNALLQHRGHVLMSAGRSIAVQNFNENSSILVMLGVYSLLIKTDLSVPATMMIFGVFVSISMLLVILKHRCNQAEYDSTHLIGEGTRHVTEEH